MELARREKIGESETKQTPEMAVIRIIIIIWENVGVFNVHNTQLSGRQLIK